MSVAGYRMLSSPWMRLRSPLLGMTRYVSPSIVDISSLSRFFSTWSCRCRARSSCSRRSGSSRCSTRRSRACRATEETSNHERIAAEPSRRATPSQAHESPAESCDARLAFLSALLSRRASKFGPTAIPGGNANHSLVAWCRHVGGRV